MKEQRRRYNDSAYNDTSNGSDSDDYPVQNGHQANHEPPKLRRRPLPQTYRTNRWERYDLDPPSLSDREFDGRGRLVRFFKNGDKFHCGVPVSVTPKKFQNVSTLCDFLNDKISLTRGVSYIFNLETGRRVRDVREFRCGDVCVVSSSNSYNKDIRYGGNISKGSMNSTPFTNSAMTIRNRLSRNHDSGSEQNPSRSRQVHNDKPVSVTIISNDDRRDRKDVILNPKTAQQFEQFLRDIGSMMTLHYPPATGMFSTRKTDIQIDSFSKLFKEVNTHHCNEFIMCGQERCPKSETSNYDVQEEAPSHSDHSEPEYEPEPEPEPTRQMKKEQVNKKKHFPREEKEPPMTSRKPSKSNKEAVINGKPRQPYNAKSPPRKSHRSVENENMGNSEEYGGYDQPQNSNRGRAQGRVEDQDNGEDYDGYSPVKKSNRDQRNRKPSKRAITENDNKHDDYNSPRKSQGDEHESRRSVKNSQKEGNQLHNRDLYGSPPRDEYIPPEDTPPQKARNSHNQPRNSKTNRFQEEETKSPRRSQDKDRAKIASKPDNKHKTLEEEKNPKRDNQPRESKQPMDSRYDREELNSSGNENDDDDSDNRSLSPITPRPRLPRMESPEC